MPDVFGFGRVTLVKSERHVKEIPRGEASRRFVDTLSPEQIPPRHPPHDSTTFHMVSSIRDATVGKTLQHESSISTANIAAASHTPQHAVLSALSEVPPRFRLLAITGSC